MNTANGSITNTLTGEVAFYPILAYPIEEEEEVAANRNILAGKRFSIVGKIGFQSEYSRYKVGSNWWYTQYDVARAVRDFGGRIGSGYSFPLTKSCDYLIVGDNPPPVTMSKLETETYKNVIPIQLSDFYKILDGKQPLPADRLEYEKQIAKFNKEQAKKLELQKKKEAEAKIKAFAAKCGIEYNTNEPEKSVYKNKKMDVCSEVVIGEAIDVKPQPKRLEIKKGTYPFVKVTIPGIEEELTN